MIISQQQKTVLRNMEMQSMKEFFKCATNVIIKQHEMVIWNNLLSLSLKEFVTHAYNVIMKQNLSIWGLIPYAVIVTIKQHRKKILKYM